MGTPTGSPDPFVALADELGRMGRRLDGMGAELRALREAGPWSQPVDVRAGAKVASDLDQDSAGRVAGSGPEPAAPAAPQVGAVSAASQQPAAPAAPIAHPVHPAGLGSAPAAYPPATYAPGYPQGAPGAPGPWWPAPPVAGPPAPMPGWPPPPPPPLPGFRVPGPQQPPAPRRSSAMSGARLLAWTGGAVTLLGVVLLMVLAASRGWFTPEARLVAGAVLGAALIGLGMWLHRKETARAGALALVATGFATLYLVVAAAAAVYGYLDPVPALVLDLVVAAAALGLADRWRSQLLAAGATAGAALLAPVLTVDWLLLALVLVLQAAAVAVVLRRRWPVLMLVAAAGPVLYGMAVGANEVEQGPGHQPQAIVLVLLTLAVALATAVLVARKVAVAPVAVLVGAAALPTVVTGAALSGLGGGVLAAVAAVALGAFAAVPGIDRAIRGAAVGAAVVALLVATVIAFDGATVTIIILGEALAAAVLAAALRSRFAMVVGLVLGAIGVLAALGRDAPLAALVLFPARPYLDGGVVVPAALVTALVIALLVIALAVALLAAGGQLGWIRPNSQTAPVWASIGLVGLYGAAVLVVAIALLIAPDRTGFTVGHAIVTVSWTVAALVLLARGISRPALRIAGLVLVAAAVAKLVLFDLTALDGLARVGAFLGAGLVLLAAGTRYARLVAEAEQRGRPEHEPDQVNTPGTHPTP
ncbi:DUF2339 domain-containing protein [Pseudonocardia sp. GCM10023141]|uniref:DUF2339 domain-containing protein n=1 Tax=Pseudonocardia sp. GCM10023141 TaxID=3252653 RepID=UPI00360A06A6